MNDLPKALKYGLVTICTVGGAIGLYSLSAAVISGLRPSINSPAEEVSPEVTYPVRIQYQTVAGNVIKVGAQRIYFASKDTLTQALGPTQQKHLEDVKLLETTFTNTSNNITALEDDLAETRETAADAYDKTVEDTVTDIPKTAGGKERFRSMLANSGGYEQADKNTTVIVTEKIEPLKNNIRRLENERNSAINELSRTRSNLSENLFDALPSRSDFITTDENGHAELTLSAVTRSYCWADFEKVLPNGQNERLRWLVLIPDELDATGTIIMSHDNLYGANSLSSLTKPSNDNLNLDKH